METTTQPQGVPQSFVEKYGVIIVSLADAIFHVIFMCLQAIKMRETLGHAIPQLDSWDHFVLVIYWMIVILFHGFCIRSDLFNHPGDPTAFSKSVNGFDFQYHQICTIHSVISIVLLATTNTASFVVDGETNFSELKSVILLLIAHGLLCHFREIMKKLLVLPIEPAISSFTEMISSVVNSLVRSR